MYLTSRINITLCMYNYMAIQTCLAEPVSGMVLLRQAQKCHNIATTCATMSQHGSKNALLTQSCVVLIVVKWDSSELAFCSCCVPATFVHPTLMVLWILLFVRTVVNRLFLEMMFRFAAALTTLSLRCCVMVVLVITTLVVIGFNLTEP